MKKASASLTTPFLCGLLLASVRTVSAQTGTIYETFGDVEYAVDRYDTADQPRFEVSFTDFDITSNYKFDVNGFVKTIKADSEKYTMTYRANGKLRRVKRRSSRRQLEEQDAADMALVGETTPFTKAVVDEMTPASATRRRLFECDECLQTWDVVCDNGVDTVCRLDGYGNPILSAGEVSINTFCDGFGTLCSERTSDDVCQDVCGEVEDCLAPLTIKLDYEYTGESEISPDELFSLDMYVIEPGGQTAYWGNPSTEIGYLSDTEYSQTYTLFGGLDPEIAIGDFTTFVQLYTGPTPITWTITATTGSGDIVLEEVGEFTSDCGDYTSNLLVVNTEEYVDNGCEEDEGVPESSGLMSRVAGHRGQ